MTLKLTEKEKLCNVEYKFNGIYSDCENLNQAFKKAIKNVKHTIRKDAVRAIELVATMSNSDSINAKA